MQVVRSLVRIKQVVQQHLAVADEKRTNEFLGAASRRDTQRIRAMLQQHFDPDAADYDGGMPPARLASPQLAARLGRRRCGRQGRGCHRAQL
jgi:hypothetical protein